MDNTNQYLMIAFDVDKPMDPSNARRKFISHSDFELLVLEMAKEVELEEVPFIITGTRHFTSSTIFYGVINYVIIDVKAKQPKIAVLNQKQ
jgi:hypothetical protein